MDKRKSILVFVLFLTILDRITKYIFLKYQYRFQGRFVKLGFSSNPNLFFEPINQRFLIVFSTAVLGILIFLIIKEWKKENSILILSLLLITAGGISNLYDRIIFGYVIDFIWVFFLPKFTFNLADFIITLGCIFLAVKTFA